MHRTPARASGSRRSRAGTARASTAPAGCTRRSDQGCDTGGVATTAAAAGLTQQEAERKLAARPSAPDGSSRSYTSIVAANVFTIFNLILLVAGVATLAFGQAQDALFLAVLVGNSGIGIAQEVRAKRTLDRLAALVAPTATVVRDGEARRVAVEEVVEDDVVLLEAGDRSAPAGSRAAAEGSGSAGRYSPGGLAPAVRNPAEGVR